MILGNRGLQVASGECEDDAGAGTRPSASVFSLWVDFRGFKSVQGSNFEGVLGLILKKLWGLTWFDAMSMSPYESPARAIHNDDDDDGDDDSL